MNIKVNPYLTWEYSDDPEIQYLNCPAPSRMRNHMPQWFKDLKAKSNEVVTGDEHRAVFAENKTIRNCLGFRGLANIGYTIPLPETITGHDTYFARGRVQAPMIEGTIFSNKSDKPWTNDDTSLYEYTFRLLHFPWRAKMAKGWRLLILPYLLDWSNDWNEFAGIVEPNYDVQHGTQVGSSLKYSTPIDPEYNYYNVETVIALKRAIGKVSKGTLTFCAVPLFDPELLDKQTKGMYNDNMD